MKIVGTLGSSSVIERWWAVKTWSPRSD